jgi:hypothetical protein
MPETDVNFAWVGSCCLPLVGISFLILFADLLLEFGIAALCTHLIALLVGLVGTAAGNATVQSEPCMRWVAGEEVPSQPSVALLLLAPFLGGTEDERGAITGRLPVELDRLGLLTATEIAAAVGNRFVAAHPNANEPDRVQWVSDPSVGWRLQGDETIGRTRCPIAYSERIGGSFPSDEFLTFLREAGVRDV